MPIVDYLLYLAPPGSGAFESVPLADFTLTIDPDTQRADQLQFSCKVEFDDSTAPAITAGRIPGDTIYDVGARVELWISIDSVETRLFKGAITGSPKRSAWNIDYVAHNDLWRLNKAVAAFSTEADVAATFADAALREAVDYPNGTLEVDPDEAGQSAAYGARGRRSWKSSAFVLEHFEDPEWVPVSASSYTVTPRLGLLTMNVDYAVGIYRLRSVSVYEEGTNEVEDNIELALTYPIANCGPGLDGGDLDLDATGITISTLVQLKTSGYVKELIDDLTGQKYAAGYRVFCQYHYEGVSVGDPVKIFGRNVYQDVPAPRTIEGVVTLDQPTSVEEIARQIVSTVTLMEPGNLAFQSTITGHLTDLDGWGSIKAFWNEPNLLRSGSSDYMYGRYKESEQDQFVPLASFSLLEAAIIERILITAGHAKTPRVTAYTVYGSNDEALPSPGAAGWEIIPGCYQVECKTAQLGGGFLQKDSSVDVEISDPRQYRHILVECRAYKWGMKSILGCAGAIQVQIFGKRVKAFEAALQDTDAFGGQAVGAETALTGTLTFASGNDEVVGSGTAFETEITEREIADGVAVRGVGDSVALRVIAVVDDTHLTLAANCPAESAGSGSTVKIPFISTYKPELLAALASLGPMAYLDDSEVEETPAGAHIRAFEVLDEKSRFYQGVAAEFGPDELLTPFETVNIDDLDHNANGIPILVEKITVTPKSVTVEGVNYRGS